MNIYYDPIKINTKSLKYKIQHWRCIHCPFGTRFNDCYDDDCSFWIWLCIKFDNLARQRRVKSKIGNNSNGNVIIQNTSIITEKYL